MSFNNLSDAETERLSILMEELGEAIQRVGKILRHGYAERYPAKTNADLDNREELELELGDVTNIIRFMCSRGDMNADTIAERSDYKQEQFKQYTHHQGF